MLGGYIPPHTPPVAAPLTIAHEFIPTTSCYRHLAVPKGAPRSSAVENVTCFRNKVMPLHNKPKSITVYRLSLFMVKCVSSHPMPPVSAQRRVISYTAREFMHVVVRNRQVANPRMSQIPGYRCPTFCCVDTRVHFVDI